MIKEFRYIIRRIIVGVGIALCLMAIKGGLIANVNAKTIESVSYPGVTYDFDSSALNYSWNLASSWSNWGSGLLYGSASVFKLTGSSTSSMSLIRSIISSSDYMDFQCYFGAVSSNNATHEKQVISYYCPMIMGSTGIQRVVFNFLNEGQADFTARLQITGTLTFVQDEQFSTTGMISAQNSTTNAINNQISNDNSNTQSIINNQNQNNQSIINNQNNNTQSIINNQNANSQAEIESQKVCTVYDSSNGIEEGYFNTNGTINTGSSSSDYVVTDFINIIGAKLEALTSGRSNVRTCFFNTNKSFVSCINTISVGEISIPTDATYVRFSIQKSLNRPTFKICQNGNQSIANGQQEINNTINNDNVDGASSEASSFFNDFQSNSHGLSGIITAPLRLIESLSSSTCSSLVLPLPFVSQNATLPCMSTVYNQFPTFYSLWQLITTGMIAYYILIKLFGHVKGMQNPDDDRIEVLNL